jgi:hypothetical protein
MHNYWAITDPAMYGIQKAAFLKNVSMLGGALLIAYFGAGPLSLDSLIERTFRVSRISPEKIKTSPKLARSKDKSAEAIGSPQPKVKEKEKNS